MFRPRTLTARRHAGRRGVILVVVLGLLTLFAVLGISFVYFADAEATAARLNKDLENQTGVLVPPDATDQVNQFLQSLLYPVGDQTPDITNSLRGHELLADGLGDEGPKLDVSPRPGPWTMRSRTYSSTRLRPARLAR